MVELMHYKKHYSTPWNVCFRCGSLDIITLNVDAERNTEVLKCAVCSKVWTRTKKEVRDENHGEETTKANPC